MRVPGAGAAVAAVEDLHEAHPLLDQPPGRQALLAERLRSSLLSSPYSLRVAAVSACKSTTSGTAVCMRKASSYDLIRARIAGSSGYSTADSRLSRSSSANSLLLLFAVHVGAGRGERQRVLGVDRQLHAVVLGAEVVGAVRADAAAAIGDGRAQDDELRQVVVERPQAVMDPRADRGKLPFEHVPAGVELELRAVIVVGGPHRADDGQVVGAVAEVRPPVADLEAALAALLKADLHAEQLVADVAVVRRSARRSRRFFLTNGESSTSLVRRFGDRLAGVFVELRLGIEALHVAHAADHEDPDHALGLGSKCRQTAGHSRDARAARSPSSMSPSARPVKPMPTSARNAAAWCASEAVRRLCGRYGAWN